VESTLKVGINLSNVGYPCPSCISSTGLKMSNHGLVLRGLAVVESDGPRLPGADTREGNIFLFSTENIFLFSTDTGEGNIFLFSTENIFLFSNETGEGNIFLFSTENIFLLSLVSLRGLAVVVSDGPRPPGADTGAPCQAAVAFAFFNTATAVFSALLIMAIRSGEGLQVT
jgi:hypothetical protein